MRENIKSDYLKYLLHKTLTDLSRFNISNQDTELISKLFHKLCYSDNVLIELYMLTNIKNFRNIGNYLIFIYKKMEDEVINFDNLSHNLNTDSEFIENELLNYLSNPKLIGKINTDHDYVKTGTEEKSFYENEISDSKDKESALETGSADIEEEIEDDDDILKFKKNYLELIQSEDSDTEIVFDLPTIQNKETDESIIFDAPSIESMEAGDEMAMELPSETEQESGDNQNEDVSVEINEDIDDAELFIKEELSEAENEIVISSAEEEISDDEGVEGEEGEQEIESTLSEETSGNSAEQEIVEEEKIPLSEEIQEELNLFNESEYVAEEEEAEEEPGPELPPTNESFIDYENELRDKNIYLNREFDKMIDFVNLKSTDEDERMSIISNIIDTTTYLESTSRKMSLEIISNIYQTITLSFEKISDGKYDLSESTLNLFKNGLSLVLSLIKGDDYFGYKDILKSIENIRNSLIEEKERREKYLQRLKEKLDLERSNDRTYPEDDVQVENKKLLKKLIKDTESKFNMLDKITGEYQIYEALRSLSGNLNNFKDIVKLSKELQLMKLVQLSEASYIFTKFLQNYRINPVTTETKEIFGYIIYNMKLLAMGKPAEDINIFISYLNDPVKIFSKKENEKNNYSL